MKIALAASAGGHLTELDILLPKEVLERNEIIRFTEKTERTISLKEKTYFFKPLGYNPFSYILPIFRCFKILRNERPGLLITTGAEIGLVAIIASRILGIKTVFIGIAGNPITPSLDGKFSYLFSNIFLVQYPELKEKYGKKAKYLGGLI